MLEQHFILSQCSCAKILSFMGRLLQEGASPVHFGPNDAFVSRVVTHGLVIYDLRNLKLNQNQRTTSNLLLREVQSKNVGHNTH